MTNKRKKITYSLYTILSYLFLVFYSKNNLLETNLSRMANHSMKDYFLLLFILFAIGISTYVLLKKIYLDKYSLLGLFSILIGAFVPYNYLDEKSIACTIHTTLAYVSFGIIGFIIILISMKLNAANKKVFNVLCFVFAIVLAINIYEIGKYGFVNTLMELTYIGYMLLLQIAAYYIFN